MSTEPAPPPSLQAIPQRSSPTPLRRALGWTLLVLAAAYLGYYLLTQWQSLEKQLEAVGPWVLPAAILSALAMLALKSAYHVLTFRRLGQSAALPSASIVSAYAVSQVIRYLPGKILGVVYEANRLSPRASAHQVVSVNVMQGLYTNALSVAVIGVCTAWLASGSDLLGIGLLAVVSLLLWYTHRKHAIERILVWVANRIPRLRRMRLLPQASGKASLLATSLLLAEWIPYFVVWAILAPAETDLVHSAVLLGACYAGASLAASLAVVAPSGIFVREAAFLWAGSQLQVEPATLIILGMVSRLVFTVADLGLAPIAWGWEVFRNKASP